MRGMGNYGMQVEFCSQLRQNMDRLIALGTDLRSCTESEVAGQIDTCIDRLHATRFRVAFIGQAKAGKTTLVNSFVRRPGLLPSDVNPWTAVVTGLHLGVPGEASHGAVFRFFDEDEWQKIGERARQLQDATEGASTAYTHGELEEQLSQMRVRAERRLGTQFRHLLGKEHRFAQPATTELLERYVCAGETPETTIRNPVAGRFADITKSADIYLPNEVFPVPLTLLDTPGTNDPLLVREEITRQSLDKADVFVLVLSAHQALSTADVTLLRLLQAMSLDRLVIFVNRADEIVDPQGQLPGLERRVRSLVGASASRTEVPVVIGSAAWAEYALTGVEDGELDLAALEACARMRGLATEAEPDAEARRRMALGASGLPDLQAALSRLVEDGPGATLLAGVTHDMTNLASTVGGIARERAGERRSQLRAARRGGEGELERIVAVRHDAEVLSRHIGAMAERFSRVFEPILGEAWTAIRTDLEREVSRFADAEADRLKAAREGSGVKRWHCDVTPLRAALKEIFLSRFAESRDRVVDCIEAADREAREAMRGEVADSLLEASVNIEDLRRYTPSTSCLAKGVSFDCEFSWWAGLLGAFGAGKRDDERIRTHVRKEFRPICDEVLNTAMEAFIEMCRNATERFAALHRAMLWTLEDRISEMENFKSCIEQARNEGYFEEEVARLEALVVADREAATRADTVRKQLTTLLGPAEAERLPECASL